MPAHIQRQATCSGLILAAATVLAFAANSSAQPAPRVTPSDLQGLTWRAIGPAVMSGRVTAVAGVPGNPRIIYVAHASGGLFKSVDGGVTFRSTFDQGGTLSIGALAVSPIAGRPVALFKPMAAVRFVRTPATALAVRADPRWKFTPEEFASHQRAGSTD